MLILASLDKRQSERYYSRVESPARRGEPHVLGIGCRVESDNTHPLSIEVSSIKVMLEVPHSTRAAAISGL